jgi:hypothetical protein
MGHYSLPVMPRSLMLAVHLWHRARDAADRVSERERGERAQRIKAGRNRRRNERRREKRALAKRSTRSS